MSGIDDLLKHAAAWADSFVPGASSPRPSRKLAVVSCMDSRIDVFAILGLQLNEAHVIRNGGGIVTDDVVRSLVLSQRLLGTEDVVLVHHTDCGMLSSTEEEFAGRMEREAGVRPPWPAGFFTDLDADVRAGIERLRNEPLLACRDAIRGFVYDVHTGELREVQA